MSDRPGSTTQSNTKLRVALLSVMASLFLALFKLVVGIATNSLGVIQEAFHSGLDMMAAVMTFYAVRTSMKVPDLEHTYGYGKIESLASLVEILLLFITAAGVFYVAILRIFFEPATLHITVYSFAIMVVSIGVDLERSRVLSRTAQKYGSQALEADALHFKADMLTSAVVIAGLAGVVLLNFPKADAFAAIAASASMVYTSLGLGRRTLDVLLDRAPKGIVGQIDELVSGLEGVNRTSNIRVRKVGPRAFVDLHIQVPRTYTNERAHKVATLVEEKLRRLLPDSDVLVHVDAVESSEGITDTIRLIAAETEGIRNVHSIFQSRPQSSGEKIHIYMDVQMDRSLDLATAHKIVDDFEKRLTAEMPEIGKVTIHEEPEAEAEGVVGSERAPDSRYAERLRRLARSVDEVVDCRDVTLVDLKGERHITLTITVATEAKGMSLERAHEIATKVQNLIMAETGATRVVVHAEAQAHSGWGGGRLRPS